MSRDEFWSVVCVKLVGSFDDAGSAFEESFDSTPVVRRLGRLTRYCCRDEDDSGGAAGADDEICRARVGPALETGLDLRTSVELKAGAPTTGALD